MENKNNESASPQENQDAAETAILPRPVAPAPVQGGTIPIIPGDPFRSVDIKHKPAPATPWTKINRHEPGRSIFHIMAKDSYADSVATIWGERGTDEAENVADLICLAVNSHSTLLAAVTGAQALLARWIVPDSGISDEKVLGDLLGILDDQALVKVVRAAQEGGAT